MYVSDGSYAVFMVVVISHVIVVTKRRWTACCAANLKQAVLSSRPMSSSSKELQLTRNAILDSYKVLKWQLDLVESI